MFDAHQVWWCWCLVLLLLSCSLHQVQHILPTASMCLPQACPMATQASSCSPRTMGLMKGSTLSTPITLHRMLSARAFESSSRREFACTQAAGSAAPPGVAARLHTKIAPCQASPAVRPSNHTAAKRDHTCAPALIWGKVTASLQAQVGSSAPAPSSALGDR